MPLMPHLPRALNSLDLSQNGLVLAQDEPLLRQRQPHLINLVELKM
jgi:hypothetical protein